MTEKELLTLAFAPGRWRPMEELTLAEWREMTPQQRLDAADRLRHETLAIWGPPSPADEVEDLEALRRFQRVCRGQG